MLIVGVVVELLLLLLLVELHAEQLGELHVELPKKSVLNYYVEKLIDKMTNQLFAANQKHPLKNRFALIKAIPSSFLNFDRFTIKVEDTFKCNL